MFCFIIGAFPTPLKRTMTGETQGLGNGLDLFKQGARTFVGVLFPVRFESTNNGVADRWLSGLAKSHAGSRIGPWCGGHFGKRTCNLKLTTACDRSVTVHRTLNVLHVAQKMDWRTKRPRL